MGKYCSKGDKAKVYYSFGGKGERIYQSDKCPIDITITDNIGYTFKDFSFDFGSNLAGATFSFRAVPPAGVPKDWDAWVIRGSWDNYGSIGAVPVPNTWPDGLCVPHPMPGNCGKAWSITGTCVEHGFPDRPKEPTPTRCNFTLEYRPPNSPQSEIQIIDANGTTFKDKGKSPCKFRVSCGGDCPESQVRIEQPGYPGYCCLDCKQLAARVESLNNRLQ